MSAWDLVDTSIVNDCSLFVPSLANFDCVRIVQFVRCVLLVTSVTQLDISIVTLYLYFFRLCCMISILIVLGLAELENNVNCANRFMRFAYSVGSYSFDTFIEWHYSNIASIEIYKIAFEQQKVWLALFSWEAWIANLVVIEPSKWMNRGSVKQSRALWDNFL